ncbi:MAG: hypothetical protein ACRDWB_09105 [Acidimicrobiales bacterium]
MSRRPKLALLTALVVFDLVLAAFAFRDLRSRDESQIRGSKRFWRIATIANPGNSLAYWLFARRRIGSSSS